MNKSDTPEWFPARYANRMHIGDPQFKVLSWSRLGTLCGREMNPGRSLKKAPKCKTCAEIFKRIKDAHGA